MLIERADRSHEQLKQHFEDDKQLFTKIFDELGQIKIKLSLYSGIMTGVMKTSGFFGALFGAIASFAVAIVMKKWL